MSSIIFTCPDCDGTLDDEGDFLWCEQCGHEHPWALFLADLDVDDRREARCG